MLGCPAAFGFVPSLPVINNQLIGIMGEHDFRRRNNAIDAPYDRHTCSTSSFRSTLRQVRDGRRVEGTSPEARIGEFGLEVEQDLLRAVRRKPPDAALSSSMLYLTLASFFCTVSGVPEGPTQPGEFYLPKRAPLLLLRGPVHTQRQG